MMNSNLKELTKKELRQEFKTYLESKNYTNNAVNTYSYQALFLFDRVGKDNFWAIVESDDFSSLARKAINNELLASGNKQNANQYLSNLRCFRTFCGIESGYREKSKDNEKTQVQKKRTKKYEPKLDIDEALCAIEKYHNSIKPGYTRLRSWEHCYNAFRLYRHDNEKTEFLCLHLSCFLASWGMLRNSSLVNYDYYVHENFIKHISSPRYDDLYNEEIPDFNLIEELTEVIKDTYPKDISKTDTFVTKVLLGAFGCVPAFDRYFKNAVKEYNVCGGEFNAASLKNLYKYYQDHADEFQKLKNRFETDGVHYTPMKMIDMCFWQLGRDMEIEKKNKKEVQYD